MKHLTIYQIPGRKKLYEHAYRYKDYDIALQNNFTLDDYKIAYEGERDDSYTSYDCFDEFINKDMFHDYHARTISVSDIIQLDDEMWYINHYGHIKIK